MKFSSSTLHSRAPAHSADGETVSGCEAGRSMGRAFASGSALALALAAALATGCADDTETPAASNAVEGDAGATDGSIAAPDTSDETDAATGDPDVADSGAEDDADDVEPAPDSDDGAETGDDATADAADAGEPDAVVEPGPACAPSPNPVRRLSHFEYRNTLADLFAGMDISTDELPADNRPHEFDNDAEGTLASSTLVEAYLDVGLTVAQQLGDGVTELVDCTPADESAGELLRCGEVFLRGFGSRVFRRPLTDDEVARYSVLMTAPVEGATWVTRLQLTLQALLSAPEFLYRIELPASEVAAGEAGALDAWSLASRLSYFAWGSMPDAALFAAAADGSLLEPEVMRTQAERLLNDERAREGFVHFHEQWLDVDRIELETKAASDNLTDELRADMQEQARRFVDAVLFDADGTLSDLLASDRVFLNASLAAIYGVGVPDGVEGSAWFETTVPGRLGMLTQPFFLASHGHPDKPSPIQRGVFVLERMMCVPLGAPPPNAEAQAGSIAETIEGPLTNRAFYELVTSDPGCVSCHQSINPVGATFEHFDTMGRYQETEPSGLAIDTTATLRDWIFRDAADMVEQLASDESTDACMVQKWARYAWAGGAAERSSCYIDELQRDYALAGGTIRDLQLAIVMHPHFATFVAPAAEGE